MFSGGANLTTVEVSVRAVYGRNSLTTGSMQAEFLAQSRWNLCFGFESWDDGDMECWRARATAPRSHGPTAPRSHCATRRCHATTIKRLCEVQLFVLAALC